VDFGLDAKSTWHIPSGNATAFTIRAAVPDIR
jgi:hypothetical protein